MQTLFVFLRNRLEGGCDMSGSQVLEFQSAELEPSDYR